MRRLSKSELRDYAPDGVFTFTDAELDEYHQLTEFIFDIVEGVEATPPAPIENVEAQRDPGRRPTPEEDPLNAIIRWCSVKAPRDGLLAGKRIGLKDNIAVGGVPLTCGSAVLQDYVPEADSVLVTRLLEAGAEIVAKTNLDNFAWSGSGDTSAFGTIRNPVDPTRNPSGSSGGSAAALYYDAVDITFGTDNGGSVRLPAAWCGVLGLKPTFGLVPYAGIMGMDQSYDYVGPLTRTVDDLALALQAVAGRSEADARQHEVPVPDYVQAVAAAPDNLSGLRIGVLQEALSEAMGVEDSVRSATLEAVERLAGLGADVKDVSVPGHLTAGSLLFVSIIEGQTATLNGFGNGYHWLGQYSEELARALGNGLKNFGDELPPQVKTVTVVGNLLRSEYSSTLYARAQNLRRSLRQAFDKVFEDVDLIVFPTQPALPDEYVADYSIAERTLNGWRHAGNTCVFNITGHPALSMPAAEAEGLPVGVHLAAPMLDESSLLRVAKTYERAFGWLPEARATSGAKAV
jgi:amidase